LTLNNQIVSWLKDWKRLAVLGIGNPLRGDDALGLEVLNQLKGKVPENVKLFECEMAPENFLGEIELFSPTHVLMIDAAQLGAEPGSTRLLAPERMAGTAVSTHALPLSILAEILRQDLEAKVALLAVQPERSEFEEGLSPTVQKAAKQIAGAIVEVTKGKT